MYGSDERRWIASMYDVSIPRGENSSLDRMGESLERAVVSLEL